MNSRSITKYTAQSFWHLALCCAAIALALMPAISAADEKEVAQQPDAKQPDPLLQGMQEGRVTIPTPEVAQAQAALQKRMRTVQQKLEQQQVQLAREYQEAMKALQQSLPRSAQLDIERQELQARLAEAKAQIAALSTNQERMQMAPLPPDAVLKVFSLRYVKPDEIGQVLHSIMGSGGPRIAIDERTNALLVAGDDKQTSVAEALIQKLDQPSESQRKSTETLQVRMVWILDGLPDTEGKNVEPPYVSAQVLEGLFDLGFETPRVMCQQVTTLTLEKDKRRGQFHFQIPVLVEGSPWQFQGQGEISLAGEDRYAMQFNLSLRQPKNADDCQLSGSIFTPLAHYNVMGTTTFLSTSPANANSSKPYQQQHLSAFVVYLDRAREFGEKAPKTEKKK